MYDHILTDIVNFKKRGAEIILKWGLLAFSLKCKELNEKCSFISTYVSALDKSKKQILGLRPNEVALTNALNYIFEKSRYNNFQSLDEIKEDVKNRFNAIEGRVDFVLHKIASIGSKKIHNNTCIYTHGHSTFVESIFEEAQKLTKFKVNLTESIYPLKDYLKSLSRLKKINLTIYPFSMVEKIIKESDFILIGSTGAVQKNFLCQSGTSTIVHLAKLFNVPIYVCCDLLKYSKKFKYDCEVLDQSLIFNNVPKEVKVYAEEFDIIDGNLFTGIICEEGIFKFNEFEHIAIKEFQ